MYPGQQGGVGGQGGYQQQGQMYSGGAAQDPRAAYAAGGVAASNAAAVQQGMSQMDLLGCQVTLFFGFESLPSRDLLSKSDPFAVVSFQRGSSGKLQPLGQTEVVRDQNTGSWAKNFDVRYVFEEQQKVVVQLYDHDDIGSHDYAGEASFFLGNVMGSPGQSLKVKLVKPYKSDGQSKNRGNLIVRAEKRESGSASGASLNLHFAGHKFDSKDWGGLRASDPYYLLERKVGDNWVKVFQSEWVKKNNSPSWRPVSISLDKLCRGNLDEPIKLSVWDFDEGSKHDIIGEKVLTVNQLVAAVGTGIEMKHPPTKSKYQKKSYKHSGLVIVKSIRVKKNPTEVMLEYIAGGLQLNLIVAVDFTGSNGNPRDPRSLHYSNPNTLNQYQTAINAVGDILMPYDHSGYIAAFGFGGVFQGQVNHCFPLNGNINDPRVQGIAGLQQAYSAALANVPLSGPTYFGTLLDKVNQITFEPEMSQANQKYTTLLILTDGIINDTSHTVSQLVKGSNLALSVIIVGVGNADFSQMEMLDGDEKALRDSTTNTYASRDIVQFVPFNQFRGQGDALAKEVLHEIPGQLVQFFENRKIAPNPPLRAPSTLIAQDSQGGISGASAPPPAPPPAVGAQPTQSSLAASGRNLLGQAFHL